jgi:hypothetical protein
MTKLFGLVGLLFAFNLLAADIVFHKERAGFYDKYFDFKYGVNADLGRAWVVVDGWESDGDPDWDSSFEFRKKIEGMHFDQTTEQIMFNEVVCAETRLKVRRRFGRTLKTRIITPTGNCSFSTKMSRELYDSGYETYYVNYYNLILSI